jgi:hypothetical protein
MTDDILEKPSRAERWKRSIAARFRRQISKMAKTSHLIKEEHDAQERMNAKHLLEKQKKNKRKTIVQDEGISV